MRSDKVRVEAPDFVSIPEPLIRPESVWLADEA